MRHGDARGGRDASCWSTAPSDRLQALCAELGPNAHPAGRRPDRARASVAGMLPAILEKAGQLDIFHANAGAYVGGDGGRGRSRRLGPDAEPQHQRRASARSTRCCRTWSSARRGDIIVTSSIAGLRAGGLGADLHRLEIRRAGLRPHRPPPGRPARRPRRRRRSRARW